MNNKGIAPIAAILLVLAGLAVLGGVFYYSYESALPSNQAPVATSTPPAPSPSPTLPTPNPTPTPTPTPPAAGAYLTPTTGPAGISVTIHGSGFAATGNKITFNNLIAASMNNLSSADG